jgi:prepilin peptidase CpaA
MSSWEIIAGITLIFLAACVAVDVRTMRIPNLLTGPAILTGFVLNAAWYGSDGLATSLAGFGLAVALLLAPFALGGVGGGDVKMMGAVGALLGPKLLLPSLMVGMMLGGVIAAVRLASSARLGEKLGETWRMFANALLSRSLDPLRAPASDPNRVVLPYSLPLGIGTAGVIAIFMAKS